MSAKFEQQIAMSKSRAFLVDLHRQRLVLFESEYLVAFLCGYAFGPDLGRQHDHIVCLCSAYFLTCACVRVLGLFWDEVLYV